MTMTPERLAEIRRASQQWGIHSGNWRTIDVADMTAELLTYIDELTGQIERARDLAVRSGYFISSADDLTTCCGVARGSHWHSDDKVRPDPNTDGLVTEWRLP